MTETVIVALIGAAATIAVTVMNLVASRRRKLCAKEQAERDELRAERQAMRDGLQSLLRAEIIRSYEKYHDKGFCPIYAKEALKIEYTAYHNLGGNDVATDLYKKTTALPTEPE